MSEKENKAALDRVLRKIAGAMDSYADGQ